MSEAATVFWTPFRMTDRKFGEPIVGEQNRKFESVENALTFVMENLSRVDRQTALIQTDYGSLHLADIEERYVHRTRARFRKF
jgi:hypothetical protein